MMKTVLVPTVVIALVLTGAGWALWHDMVRIGARVLDKRHH